MRTKKGDENITEGGRGMGGKRMAQGEREGGWFFRTECRAIQRARVTLRGVREGVGHAVGRGALRRLESVGEA